jgi:Regulator of chromosome condensation (RCC1) repeat
MVAAGYFQSCAILDDGTASCWGEGIQAPMPVPLTSKAPVRALATGTRGALALFEDGTVQDLAPSGTSASFVLPGERAIAAGGAWGQDECAVLTNGALRCAAPLADVASNVSNVFTAPLSAHPRLTAISFEGEHGDDSLCGLLEDGTVRCISGAQECTPAWCDDSTTATDDTIAIKLGQPAVALTTGGSTHTCALLANGAVRCWGEQGLTASYAPLGAAFPPLLIDSETFPHETFHDIDLGARP